MPTDPAITRILNRTPLYKKVSVSKVFDFAEEVNAALERTGHTIDWLAEEVGVTVTELMSLLSGMDSFYDPVARIEAAFKMDLLIGATQRKCYFVNEYVFIPDNSQEAEKSGPSGHIDMVVLAGREFDKFYGVRWHDKDVSRQRTVKADISTYLTEEWDNMSTFEPSSTQWLKK